MTLAPEVSKVDSVRRGFEFVCVRVRLCVCLCVYVCVQAQTNKQTEVLSLTGLESAPKAERPDDSSPSLEIESRSLRTDANS